MSASEKAKIVKNLTPTILARKPKMCNIIEYSDHKVVYKRYASLFFIVGVTPDVDNELLTLEVIHRFVETMDTYFGNVCELDIIFNFNKVYDILNEMVMVRWIHRREQQERGAAPCDCDGHYGEQR